MFEFHKDKQRYFNWQHYIARDYIIPFVSKHVELNQDIKVLEIGCGEAGVLKAFLEKGVQCTGIELMEGRVELAKQFLAEEHDNGQVSFIVRNIYDIDVEKDLSHKFDLIILKDVIEHIPNQEKFMVAVKDFLNPKGKIFFAFPPWHMPFGGHQQVIKHKFFSKLPYYHLLPRSIYKAILKRINQSERTIDELLELQEIGITIERFQKISKRAEFKTISSFFYLFNPIYQYKFGVKPRKQFGLINKIPFVRNFLTTCAYFLVEKE